MFHSVEHAHPPSNTQRLCQDLAKQHITNWVRIFASNKAIYFMSWFPSPEDVHVYVRCSYSILCFLHPPSPPPSPTHSRIICMDFCSALSKRTRKRLEVKTKMKTNCFLRDENYKKKKHDTVDSASIASRKKRMVRN